MKSITYYFNTNRVRLLLTTMLLSSAIASANYNGSVEGGDKQIDVNATPYSIGVRWNVSEQFRNSEFTLEYYDDSLGEWQPSAPALHALPETRHGGHRTPLNEHYWASSLVNLQPNTRYKLRAQLVNSSNTYNEEFTVTTKGFIKAVDHRVLHVSPAGSQSGDGSGSESNPINGLQKAANIAKPGDTFLLKAGKYRDFAIEVSGTADAPIAWIGPDEGEAIIDGRDTHRGVITLEGIELSEGIGYHLIKGLTIQNGRWGIDASFTHHISILDNNIIDVEHGFFNRRDTSVYSDQQLCGNIFTGRTTYPGYDRTRRGLRIKGDNNLVCFNTISQFGDCISTDAPLLNTRGSDIVGNDVSQCADDGIEIDHGNSNDRVWRNRVSNSTSGISVQPLYGGPAYIFRNTIINVDERTIKLHNNPSGIILYHNTGYRSGSAFSDDESSSWPNSTVKNNAFWGSFYAYSSLNTEGADTRVVDYNAMGSSRNDGGNTYWIGNTKYPSLNEVHESGLMLNSLPLDASYFYSVGSVAKRSITNVSQFDLRLDNESTTINAGDSVDHLNKAYVFDSQPDMGAYEAGQVLPVFGVTGFDID